MSNNQIQHSWDLTYQEAVRLQNELHSKVDIRPLALEKIKYLAAADISYQKKNPDLFGAVLLFTFPELILVESQTVQTKATFPYIPGLLSFREVPALLPLFKNLGQRPDVILVDGQGIAHPRRFGIASHLGVLLGIPAIGCAKSKLVGEFEGIPEQKGDWTSLRHKGEEIGKLLCTRDFVKPIFISVGHLVNLDSALKIVMKTVKRYRIPEPIRQAHILVNQMRINYRLGN
jgi:deoxyribonuclease V